MRRVFAATTTPFLVLLPDLTVADANDAYLVATGTTIGHKRILPTPLTKATSLRVTIAESIGTPALARIALAKTAAR